MHAIGINYCLHACWHYVEEVAETWKLQVIPSFLDCFFELCRRHALKELFLKLMLNDKLYALNWIEVRAVRRPLNHLNSALSQILLSRRKSMTWCIVLHQDVLTLPLQRAQSHPAVHDGYYLLHVCDFPNLRPVLLLEQTRPFLSSTGETPPQHPSI